MMFLEYTFEKVTRIDFGEEFIGVSLRFNQSRFVKRRLSFVIILKKVDLKKLLTGIDGCKSDCPSRVKLVVIAQTSTKTAKGGETQSNISKL